jgi:hypothetical protein
MRNHFGGVEWHKPDNLKTTKVRVRTSKSRFGLLKDAGITTGKSLRARFGPTGRFEPVRPKWSTGIRGAKK